MNNLITVDAAREIDALRADIEPLLAGNGQSYDRLRGTFLIAVQQEPKILECTPESLRREISKCAADGVVPDSKEAVLLPYWDNKEKAYIAQYQPMVYGIIKRMKELGDVFSIVCNLVYANDEFVLDEANPDSLSHKSDRFATDRGPIVGGYVIFRDDKKRLMHLETMTAEDFENVQKASKAPNSPAWRNWKPEMCRKALLRRGSKYISINNDKIRALLERQDEMFDFSQPRQSERVDPFSGQTIDHDTQTQTQTQTQDDQQRGAARDERLTQRQADTSSQVQSNGQVKTETKSDEKPVGPPTVPDLEIKKEDHATVVEAVEKLLAIALDTTVDAPARRGVLKAAAPTWKDATPEYVHVLVKACVEMSDWAIKRDVEKLAWQAEHAMFVHKLKQLLEVEKLNVGKYP